MALTSGLQKQICREKAGLRHGRLPRAPESPRRDTHGGLRVPQSSTETRLLPVCFRHSCAARRQPNLVR